MITDLYGAGEMGPTLSLALVVIATVRLMWTAIVALGRARKRRALAEHAARLMEHQAELREGEIVLSGVVEHAPGHDVAVRIDVIQDGTESESSGTWSYRWTETERKIVVKPFYLRLDDGTRVRVMAPPDVEVADALDRKVLISTSKRILSAELVPNETLHAQGRLQRGSTAVAPGGEQGYRDVEYEWELVPANGRMLLSSEPLGKGLAERAKFHRRAGIRALVVLAAIHVSLIDYYARLGASDTPAKILKRDHVVSTDSDGGEQHEYKVALEIPKRRLVIEIDEDDFERAQVGRSVAVREGPIAWKLGSGSTLYWPHAIALVVFAFSTWILYHVRRVSTRPWFRRQVNHGGSGRLPGN